MNDGTKLFHHDTDGLGTRFGGCRAKYRSRKKPVGVKITYKAEEQTLQVQLHMGAAKGWEPCLSKDGIELVKNGYFGFSGANRKDDAGDKHQVHDFRMWDLSMQADNEKDEEAKRQEAWKKEDAAPDKQTHELVEITKVKGKDLQVAPQSVFSLFHCCVSEQSSDHARMSFWSNYATKYSGTEPIKSRSSATCTCTSTRPTLCLPPSVTLAQRAFVSRQHVCDT